MSESIATLALLDPREEALALALVGTASQETHGPDHMTAPRPGRITRAG